MRRISLRSLGIVLALLALCGGAFAFWSLHKNTSVPSYASGPATFRTGTETVIRREGPQKAYAAFKVEHAGDEFSVQHNAAHIFGEALYEAVGLKGVGTCDTDFNYGCFHGFLTQAVAKEGLESIKGLDTACAATAIPAACQHGVGHGILEYLGHTKLTEALAACKLTNQPDPVAGCTSGVFMEYNVPIVFGEDGTAHTEMRPVADRSKPYDLCPSLPSEYQAVCYYSLPQWWKQVYGDDFVRIGKYCAQAPTAHRIDCVNGLGSITAPTSGFDADIAIGYCDIPDADLRARCLVATAGSFRANINDAAGAAKVCAAVPAALQSQCMP